MGRLLYIAEIVILIILWLIVTDYGKKAKQEEEQRKIASAQESMVIHDLNNKLKECNKNYWDAVRGKGKIDDISTKNKFIASYNCYAKLCEESVSSGIELEKTAYSVSMAYIVVMHKKGLGVDKDNEKGNTMLDMCRKQGEAEKCELWKNIYNLQ